MGNEVGLDVAAAHVLECQARRFEVAHTVLPPRRDERDVPLQREFILLMLRLHRVVLRPEGVQQPHGRLGPHLSLVSRWSVSGQSVVSQSGD